jgi:hypothetical protein
MAVINFWDRTHLKGAKYMAAKNIAGITIATIVTGQEC